MIKKTIRKHFGQLKQILKLNSYQHPQTFNLSYSVKISNTGKQEKDFFLIIPEPSSNQHQKIIGQIKYDPKNNITQTDNLYKNKYSSWKINLKSAESAVFRQDYAIKIQPTKPLINKKFYLNEYQKMAPELIKTGEIYCRSNKYVNGLDTWIKKIASNLLNEIDEPRNLIKIVKKINKFVINYLVYQNPIPGLYTYEQALNLKTVDCGGFDTFFASICQAMGIPARVVCGFYVGYNKNTMHAWAEFMLPDGTWVPVDPSVEQLSSQGKTLKSGKFGFCGSDRIIFSVGCDIPLTMEAPNKNTDNTHNFDILQNPIIYPEDPQIVYDLEVITSPSP